MTKQRPLLGIAFMIAAMLVFPFLDVVAKHLGNLGIPVVEIVWARLTFGLLLTVPLLWRIEGRAALWPRDHTLQILRALFLVLSTLGFFGALRFLGIAETLAIYFVQPLAITLLAPLLLGEHVGLRRWIAVLVGFAGVLLIIRPGMVEFNWGVALALWSGFGSAITLLITRKLAGGSSAVANTAYTNFYGAIIASVLVVWFWKTPTPYEFGMFILLGAIGTAGNYLSLKALTYAEASLLAPFGYTEMINAVLLGWYFFGDFPDQWTFAGITVLIASAIYISWRERVNAGPVPAP
jgi:drug/metabolite transporter (DMT)-like permease